MDKGIKNSIVSSLNTVHGINWGADKLPNSSYPNRLYIHYPEIIVTNDKNHKHNIKDLIVRLKFNNEGHICYEMRGDRMTMTPGEIMSYYRHSHLSGGFNYNKMCWGEFCLGNDKTFLNAFGNLCEDYDEDKFNSLLYSINSYVEYENLNGGPYYYIHKISDKLRDNINIDYNVRDYFQTKPQIPVIINSNSITVNEELLEQQLREFFPLTHVKNEYGSIVPLSNQIADEDYFKTKSWYNQKPATLTLNSQTLTKKIIFNNNGTNTTNDATHINPNIIRDIEYYCREYGKTGLKNRLIKNVRENNATNYIPL